MKRTLIITQDIEQSLFEKIQHVIPEWNIIASAKKEDWEHRLPEAEVIMGWRSLVKEYCFNEKAKLRWLQAWSAGVDFIPLSLFEQHNICITSANGVHAYPISESVFAFMLSFARNIPTHFRNQLTKTWGRTLGKTALELHGKTLGIIGVGAIGKEIAKLAKAFQMNVLGVRNSGAPEQFVDKMYTKDELYQVLPQCDYVVAILPLTEETYRLFSKKEFETMKDTAFFINVGRGELVDEQALIEALKEKKIAGAGLDVFETEPLSENSPLWEMENVMITPHVSGLTIHYNERLIEDIFIPNLQAYIVNGRPALNIVDFTKGY